MSFLTLENVSFSYPNGFEATQWRSSGKMVPEKRRPSN